MNLYRPEKQIIFNPFLSDEKVTDESIFVSELFILIRKSNQYSPEALKESNYRFRLEMHYFSVNGTFF